LSSVAVAVPQRVASIDAVSYFEHTVYGPNLGVGDALPILSLLSGTAPTVVAGGTQYNDLGGEAGRLPNAASGQIRGVYVSFRQMSAVGTAVENARRSRFVRELLSCYQGILVVGDVVVCRFPVGIHGAQGPSIQGVSDAAGTADGLHESGPMPIRGAFLKHPVGSNQRIRMDLMPRLNVPTAQRLSAAVEALNIQLRVGVEVEIATAVMAVK